MILFIQKLMATPTKIPRSGPPNETLTKFVNTPSAVEVYPFAKSIKSMKKTIAVPSFSKDSPSTKVLNLTLAPSSFSKATTATGSVADKTHPKVNA
jgi:hypothetical protein